MTTMVVKI